ncbi:hypothetical protein [Sandarakinorhabdus sp.]|uniref:hypothetical protein n=1 Tax=Sandarakinorhabdus sp. TaxID=1916663 RepID=UPI0035690FB4
MPSSVREAAIAAIFARLTTELAGVVVERVRRSPIDVTRESLPRAVVTAGDIDADATREPMQTHYTLNFTVAAYVDAVDDLALDRALSDLHARIVAALVGWQPATLGLGEVAEGGAGFEPFPAGSSKAPAGEMLASFSILAIAPTGAPYL